MKAGNKKEKRGEGMIDRFTLHDTEQSTQVLMKVYVRRQLQRSNKTFNEVYSRH